MKMSHFKKYWVSVDEDDIIAVLKTKVWDCLFFLTQYLFLLIQTKFEERYKHLRSLSSLPSVPSHAASRKKHSRLNTLLRDNLHTDSEAEDEDDTASSATSEPWEAEFHQYLKAVEAVNDDVDIISWWGVSDHHGSDLDFLT